MPTQPRSNFSRQPSGRRSQRDRILIVCEDSVAGRLYFEDLRIAHGLSTVDVRVYGGAVCGNAPTSIYTFALDVYENDRCSEGNRYDKVYCIFDRDGHGDFDTAIARISGKGPPFQAIPSYPCFEFWVLLHKSASTAPLANGAAVEREIKKHWSCYKKNQKGYRNWYPILAKDTDKALKNSKSVYKQVTEVGGSNPSTLIHIVVEHLIRQGRL